MKKILTAAFAMVMAMGLSITAFAAEQAEISSYESLLDSINEEYNLELGYVPVDSSVSIEEYEATVRELAIQQRELLDYIDSKEATSVTPNLITSNLLNATAASSVTKTKSKPVWGYESLFNIKATYTVTNGSTIGKCSNASYSATAQGLLAGAYYSVTSGPTYNVIDSGKTSTVTYKGIFGYTNTLVLIKNVTFYTEFYYSE